MVQMAWRDIACVFFLMLVKMTGGCEVNLS